jgi:hypothetical protein
LVGDMFGAVAAGVDFSAGIVWDVSVFGWL